MTETTSSPSASLPQPPIPQSKTRRALLSLLIVLILLILGGASYFALMQYALSQRLSDLENTRTSTMIELNSLRSELNSQSENHTEAETLHAAALQRLEQQNVYLTQQLAQLASGTRTDWLLAEAEYLMRLANQRMNLEHDPRGAEAMLRAADQVLAEIADPALFAVREQLAKEVLAIQSVQPVDREQTFAQLQALTAMLDKIAPGQFANLTELEAPPPATAAEPESLWEGIKSDFLRVFRIQRLDQPVQPLMAPEHSYYLQQNLRLMLEQASHALISQESEMYQGSLAKAGQWLQRYFDQGNPQVQTMLNALASLKQVRIRNGHVDLAQSLRLLRQHIETLQRQHLLTPNLAPASATNATEGGAE